MNTCECRNRIEQLRRIMELTFNNFESFTNAAVLEASQSLDDALVQYRSCPDYDFCNSNGCRVRWQDVDHLQMNTTIKKRIAG
ncbi:Spo0E family sporulation regulatory protein-aspartic acid phosphatase [Paenibacillus sp. strain BS8-2]